MVDKLINDGTATVEVLDTTSKWFGVTYPEDRQSVLIRSRHWWMPVNILRNYFKMRGSVVTLIIIYFRGLSVFFRTAPVGLLFLIFCFYYCILYSLGDNPVWCLKYLPKKEGFGKFIK